MSGAAERSTILPPDLSDGYGLVEDPTRVTVEVVTTSSRALSVEFRVRMDTVEVWSWEHCGAIFDRERLRMWLAAPFRWVAEGEVVLNVDPRSNGDRIALNLPDVAAWTLSPKEFATLRERV